MFLGTTLEAGMQKKHRNAGEDSRSKLSNSRLLLRAEAVIVMVLLDSPNFAWMLLGPYTIAALKWINDEYIGMN